MKRVKELTALRDERLARLRQLRAVEQQLCITLSEEPYDISSVTVPSELQLVV